MIISTNFFTLIPKNKDCNSKKQFIKKVEDKLDEEFLNPKDLSAKIDDLEKLMLSHANKLEFEEAASLRDKISNLKEKLLLS